MLTFFSNSLRFWSTGLPKMVLSREKRNFGFRFLTRDCTLCERGLTCEGVTVGAGAEPVPLVTSRPE